MRVRPSFLTVCLWCLPRTLPHIITMIRQLSCLWPAQVRAITACGAAGATELLQTAHISSDAASRSSSTSSSSTSSSSSSSSSGGGSSSSGGSSGRHNAAGMHSKPDSAKGRADLWRSTSSRSPSGVGQQQQQQQQQQWSRQQPDAALLTSLIKRSSSPAHLLRLVRCHGAGFNTINLSAAFSRLARLSLAAAAAATSPEDAVAAAALPDLLEQLLLPQLQQCDQRTFAAVVWACSRLRRTRSELFSLCLDAFMRQLASVTEPQHISSVLWAAASSRARGEQALLAPAQVQQLLDAFCRPELLQRADAQALATAIWAAASLQQLQALALPEQQMQQLLDAFCLRAHVAAPQALANVVWAVASAGLRAPRQQLQQLAEAFVAQRAEAQPQEVSMLAWALASLGHRLPLEQLLQLLDAFTAKLPAASEQAVANMLHACGSLRLLPAALLTALDASRQQRGWAQLLAGMTGQGISSVAVSLGNLGHADQQLHALLLQEALRRLPQGQGSPPSASSGGRGERALSVQGLCTIAWSAAVLDLRQVAGQLLPLAQAASRQQVWGGIAVEGLRQLWQVHLWLLDCRLPGLEQGLAGVLAPHQLEQCGAAWQQLLLEVQQQASQLQCDLFAALQQLPLEWQQPPQLNQLCQPDGALCVDITAVTAGGVLLAIEADGPSHFRQPDRGLTGTTRFRNRALAARGYCLVSVPWHKWRQQRGQEQQQQWLLELIRGGELGM